MVARIGPTRPVRHYLREWREFRQLTQQRLAERMDTGKDQISRWESGGRSMSFEVQCALAEALDIAPADLFRDPLAPSADDLLRAATQEQRDMAMTFIKTLLKMSN